MDEKTKRKVFDIYHQALIYCLVLIVFIFGLSPVSKA